MQLHMSQNEENSHPPLRNPFGMNSKPTPMNPLMSVKNVLTGPLFSNPFFF
jgi:hypothetical protein